MSCLLEYLGLLTDETRSPIDIVCCARVIISDNKLELGDCDRDSLESKL